jgi:dihydrofolate reductase
MDQHRGIGYENRVPWKLSADLKKFKQLTMGHHILMGRKTFESIGQPLPGRISVVITRNPAFQPQICSPSQNCYLTHSLDEALRVAEARGEAEAFIIGGGEIYALALGRANRIYLTLVHTQVQADVFFPFFDENDWIVEQAHEYPADEKNQFPFTFKRLHKKS